MLAAPAESLFARHAVALLALLAAALAFSPLVVLRYDFHDSWSFLFILNAARVYNFAIGCLETHEHSYLIGRPLATPVICAMTAFGPVLDLLWVPKLQAFLALLGSGGILAAELRRAGAGAGVAALCVLSLLFLPGTQLMVAHMAANPIAPGVLAATIAGYLWVRRLRRPAATRGGCAARIALALALLVAAMAIYQIVATVFFAPVLIALLFAPPPEGRAAFRFALGAVAAFAAASAIYLVAHHSLLYGFHYFFLVPDQVAGISSTMRSASVGISPEHFLGKLGHLGVLLPEIGTLWFVSEWAPFSRPAALAAAAAALAGAALLARRPGGLWRLAAVAIVAAAFFAPYFASDSAGNGIYSFQRVRMYMQVPAVLLIWWLVHLLLQRRSNWPRAAAGLMASAIFAGAAAAYIVIFRAYVIPNYMELKHVEDLVRDAVRQDIKQIYIVQPDPARLRLMLGTHGRGEFASITSAHSPLHMVTAISTEAEGRRPQRAIIPVPAEKGGTIVPAPGRLILDLRHFP